MIIACEYMALHGHVRAALKVGIRRWPPCWKQRRVVGRRLFSGICGGRRKRWPSCARCKTGPTCAGGQGGCHGKQTAGICRYGRTLQWQQLDRCDGSGDTDAGKFTFSRCGARCLPSCALAPSRTPFEGVRSSRKRALTLLKAALKLPDRSKKLPSFRDCQLWTPHVLKLRHLRTEYFVLVMEQTLALEARW